MYNSTTDYRNRTLPFLLLVFTAILPIFTQAQSSRCRNDTIPPRFYFCPTNYTVNTTNGCMRVRLPSPSIGDNCGIRSLTSSVYWDSCLRVGVTNITYTARDFAGNTSSCSFTVTVNQVPGVCNNDTEKPVFTRCPAGFSVSTYDNCTRVRIPDAGATDNCRLVSVTPSAKWDSCLSVGANTIIYTATDAGGNTATCSTVITVNKITDPCASDTVKPRIVYCPTSYTVSTYDSCTRVHFPHISATDNCRLSAVTTNVSRDTCLAAGVTAIIYTAKDAAGNTATCSFNITVNRIPDPCATDTTKPRFRYCPTTAVDAYTRRGCIKVCDLSPSAKDNCSRPIVVGNIRGDSCLPLGTHSLIFTATDRKGNTASCQFTVNIKQGYRRHHLASTSVMAFDAYRKDNQAVLTWVASSANSEDYYVVEKWNNTAGGFEALDIVNTNWSGSDEYYNYIDKNTTDGDNTYRIISVSPDETPQFSEHKTVIFNALKAGFEAYPNPATTDVTLNLRSIQNTKSAISIINVYGKVLKNMQFDNTPSNITINTEDLLAGQYFIQINAEGRRAMIQKLAINQ